MALVTPLSLEGLALFLPLAALTLFAASRLKGTVPLEPLERRRGLFPLLIVAAAIAAGLPTLSGDFLGDDFGWVFLFHDRPFSEIFVLRDISHGVWGGLPLDELRPLFPLSFRLNAVVSGADPRGYHAANILLHALNALLVYAVGVLLLGRRLPSFLGAWLFAWAPGHAEAIAWVSGRVDLLPTAFYLGSLLSFLAWRKGGGGLPYLASLALFGLGLLSKEILVTLPLVLLLSDLVAGSERAFRRVLLPQVPFALVGLVYLLVRRLAFGNFVRERRLLPLGTFLAGQVHDLRTFVPPLDVAGRLGRWDLILLGVLAGLLLAGLFSLEKRALPAILFLGPVFYAVTVLPLLVTYPSPRHLYLPSVGPLLALGLVALPARGVQAWRLAGSLLFLALCAPALLRHEAAWGEASALSREARRGIARAAEEIPEGSLVVLTGIPNELGETMVWDFALPFALRKPFLETDLYERLRILESPGIYCCPAGEWFEARRGLLASLLVGGGSEGIEAYSLHWNPRRKEIVFTRGSFTREAFRARVEALAHRPPALPRDPREAQELAPAVLEAVRTLCGD